MDELDSHLMLTCIAVDLICELLTGVGSTNTLQQEAVVRWTKLLFGNVTEPILQVITYFSLFFIITIINIIFVLNCGIDIIYRLLFCGFSITWVICHFIVI